MMEHAEHSPAAIREKAAGAVNCQSVTLPSFFCFLFLSFLV